MSAFTPVLRHLVIVHVAKDGNRVFARLCGKAYEFIIRGRRQVEAYVHEDAPPHVVPDDYGVNWGLAQFLGLLPDEAVSDLDRALASKGGAS